MTATPLLKEELKRFLSLHQARINCLTQLMQAMISVRTVNLTQLALAFQTSVQSDSVYQRLKRFLRQPVFETDQVTTLVTSWLALGDRRVLCLARTNAQLGRKPIN